MKCILAWMLVIGCVSKAHSTPIANNTTLGTSCAFTLAATAPMTTVPIQTLVTTNSSRRDVKLFIQKLKMENENVIEMTKKALAKNPNETRLTEMRHTVTDFLGETRVILSQLIAQQENPEINAQICSFQTYSQQLDKLSQEIDRQLEALVPWFAVFPLVGVLICFLIGFGWFIGELYLVGPLYRERQAQTSASYFAATPTSVSAISTTTSAPEKQVVKMGRSRQTCLETSV